MNDFPNLRIYKIYHAECFLEVGLDKCGQVPGLAALCIYFLLCTTFLTLVCKQCENLLFGQPPQLLVLLMK